MKELLQGNGVSTEYKYYDESGLTDPANTGIGVKDTALNNSFRLESINIVKEGVVIAETHYEYDRLDNILKKTFHEQSGSMDMIENFTYDHQNRLKTAKQSNGYYDYTYQYSEDNNILKILSPDENRYYVYNAPAGLSGRTIPYAVKEIRENDASGPVLFSYKYDENGNVTESNHYTIIEINAKAQNKIGMGDSPVMKLHIAGKKPIEWQVTNKGDFHTYRWIGHWNGSDTIDVVFANGDESPDSSLIIDWIKINGTIIQAENPNVVYDRGSWRGHDDDGAIDSQDTTPGTETMDAEGALRFTLAVTSGISSGSRFMEYDFENRLVSLWDSAGLSTFEYNEGEERIKKNDSITGETIYYFFENYEESWEGTTPKESVNYYFANNLRLAQ